MKSIFPFKLKWVIVIIITCIALGIIFDVLKHRLVSWIDSHAEIKVITKTLIVKDTLTYADSVEIMKLKPMLRTRERCKLKPYKDSLGNTLTGYGHIILKGEDMLYRPITMQQADSMLTADIIRHYWYVRAKQNEDVMWQTYKMFISGTY